MSKVTLVYEDGSTWFAGEFNDLESAQAWVDQEKSKPYWKESTQALIEPKDDGQ